MSLKQVIVDEVLRLIISCPTLSPDDVSSFLAALILQYFERPDSEQVMDPVTKRVSHRAKYASQSNGIKKIRMALDLFFPQFVRISHEKCN